MHQAAQVGGFPCQRYPRSRCRKGEQYMKKRNKILSGVLALTMGVGLVMPMTASAYDYDHDGHHRERHEWRERENDRYYRGYEYTPRYAYGNHPGAYGNRALPADGQGMINRRNPNLSWACDSDGHHCHWARR